MTWLAPFSNAILAASVMGLITWFEFGLATGSVTSGVP